MMVRIPSAAASCAIALGLGVSLGAATGAVHADVVGAELLRQDAAALDPLDGMLVEARQEAVAGVLAKFCPRVAFRRDRADALGAAAPSRADASLGPNPPAEARRQEVERARAFQGLPGAYVEAMGLRGATEAKVCDVALAEVAAGSPIGRLPEARP
jgi:hypothetical protein